MSFRVRFSHESPGVAYVPQNQQQSPTPSSSKYGPLLTELLKRRLPGDYPTSFYQMDIYTAASIGDEKTLAEIVKMKPTCVNEKNRCGWTPLMYSAYLGHNGVTNFLLNNGAMIDDTNDKGQTAMMMASACGNTNIVRLLLERGANISFCDKEKRQALHYAASCNQNVVVDTLLLANANPNAADATGMTALHEAALSGHELTFLSLLEKGGDVDLKNNKGENAASLASDNPKILILINDFKKEQGTHVPDAPGTLSQLLSEMDLSRYYKEFQKENIDLNLFFELKKEDLDDMKIAYGPKKRMLDVIERYRTTGIIQTDAFETKFQASPVPSYPKASESSDKSDKVVESLRQIGEINSMTKKFAMEALEALGSGDTNRIRANLIGIIDSVEQITVKVATSATTTGSSGASNFV